MQNNDYDDDNHDQGNEHSESQRTILLGFPLFFIGAKVPITLTMENGEVNKTYRKDVIAEMYDKFKSFLPLKIVQATKQICTSLNISSLSFNVRGKVNYKGTLNSTNRDTYIRLSDVLIENNNSLIEKIISGSSFCSPYFGPTINGKASRSMGMYLIIEHVEGCGNYIKLIPKVLEVNNETGEQTIFNPVISW